MAKVSISGLANWMDIEKRLNKIPLIASIDVKALKSDMVYISVMYGTTIEALEAQLAKQRLVLEAESDDMYTLKEQRP